MNLNVINIHGIFGWSYPPGCNGPPDESIPACCENCEKEKEELFGDGTCGSCMGEQW
ncbi:MAG: hypothetical protein IBX39_08115 [Candidatus Methanoperedenaceae archaeon]|nr:hypothetical protein [Candidatus Methanoperedenaceae archaeon]